MQPTVFRALEFDRVREALAREALTPLGRARAEALTPSTDPAEVQRLLELTSQAFAFEARDGSLGIDAPDNLAAACAALDVEDRPLEPLQLIGLARFLDSVEAVSGAIMRSALAGALLRDIAARATSFAPETSAIRRAIQPSGDINDDASPALREIREKLRRQRGKLRTTLESFTRGRDAAKYLQDQIVTDRNGRYVLVVRAEHGQAIPGIVHGSSASGASLYLEPLSTVELNNEIVTLAEREVEEVRRILLALSRAFRLRADDVATTLDVAADLDELHAKARLAHKVDGRAPELTTDGRLEFRGARHPLLIPAIRDLLDDEPQARTTGTVVASDLLVLPPTRALVISGPNTGGKTVALKAMGLLSLMAQSGLLIPVEAGSKVTPFRSVFADIGDEQSISASLSTFSAHVANLVAMNNALELPALVLLDEVGGGTDPVEGGALGTAVIEHFRQRGATVVATTHDDALKSYAATTDGVMTAGFGFNPETYAPTYRIVYGAPGRSLALEIADRLGMPPSVIAAARARRSGREAQLAAHLARMDQELAALEAERRLVEESRRGLTQRAAELSAKETQVTEREAALRRRTDEKLNERLRDAREQIDAVVADLKVKAAALAEQAERRVGQSVAAGRGHGSRDMLTTGEVGGLRAQSRAALGSIGHALSLSDAPAVDEDALREPPAIGQIVFVASFGAEGIVRGISTKDVDVEIRGKRMRVPLSGLRKATKGTGERRRAHGERAQATTPTPHAARELMLIGVRVEEAIERSEKLLDAAILADERRLRIVHGHGTGRLRDGLRAFFRQHPLVSSVTTAPEHEGGDGATIVELKD